MTLQSMFGSGALEATRQNVVQLVRRRFWECEDLGFFVGKHCCNVSLTKNFHGGELGGPRLGQGVQQMRSEQVHGLKLVEC